MHHRVRQGRSLTFKKSRISQKYFIHGFSKVNLETPFSMTEGGRRIGKLIKGGLSILSQLSSSRLEGLKSELVHTYRTSSFLSYWHLAPSPKERNTPNGQERSPDRQALTSVELLPFQTWRVQHFGSVPTSSNMQCAVFTSVFKI